MRIGIDLGGTKIEAIALNENGATLLRPRVPTPTGDYVGTLGISYGDLRHRVGEGVLDRRESQHQMALANFVWN